MPYGFRIKQSWTRIDASLVAAFRALPAANVSDSMQRLAAAAPLYSRCTVMACCADRRSPYAADPATI